MIHVVIDNRRTSIKYRSADAKGQLRETHEMPTGPKEEDLTFLTQQRKSWLVLKKHPWQGLHFRPVVDPDKGEIFYACLEFPTMRHPFKKNRRDLSESLRDWKMIQLCRSRRSLQAMQKDRTMLFAWQWDEDRRLPLAPMVQVFHGFSNSACEVGYLHCPDGAFQDLASYGFVEYVASMVILEQWNGRRIFKQATKEIKSYGWNWSMVAYLEKDGQYRLCGQSEVIVLRGIMAQEAILKPKSIKRCAELVPSQQIRSVWIAHHQNAAVCWGLLPL